jgi:vacuolar-type H+-ATPase subunit E/Vma4
MLKRNKKTLARQRAIFFIPELVEFFRSRLSDEVSLIPTDKEFLADEALQQRLAMIVTKSQKADFAQKVKLAQKIVQILEILRQPRAAE